MPLRVRAAAGRPYWRPRSCGGPDTSMSGNGSVMVGPGSLFGCDVAPRFVGCHVGRLLGCRLCHGRLSVVVCETLVLVVGLGFGGLAAPPPPARSRKGRGGLGSSSRRSGLLLATMRATSFGSGGVKAQSGGV